MRSLLIELRRLLVEGLAEELRDRVGRLLRRYDVEEAKQLGYWIDRTFRVSGPRTPRGGKELKERLAALVWVLRHRVGPGEQSDEAVLGKARDEVELRWGGIAPQVDRVVALFSDEGGKAVPKERVVRDRRYVNRVELSGPTFDRYVDQIENLLGSLHGWRVRALDGKLTVVLAGPRDFHGTAGGRYRREEDALYVRATPAVLRRDEGYASLNYILVHELGHRYERLHGLPVDFDRPEWWTSRYSKTESLAGSEAFAELFAIGHFDLAGPWSAETVERFERAMASR